MATSLYDLSAPTFLQTVSAVAGFLDRTVRHCAETTADPDDLERDSFKWIPIEAPVTL